jgi:hypothetical protein
LLHAARMIDCRPDLALGTAAAYSGIAVTGEITKRLQAQMLYDEYRASADPARHSELRADSRRHNRDDPEALAGTGAPCEDGANKCERCGIETTPHACGPLREKRAFGAARRGAGSADIARTRCAPRASWRRVGKDLRRSGGEDQRGIFA